VWPLADFLTCWVLLSPEARWLIYMELRRWNQPRVWRFECGESLLIGG
jgi:hypothetical protein